MGECAKISPIVADSNASRIHYPRYGEDQMGQDLQKLNAQNKTAEWAAKIAKRRNSGQSVRIWRKENGVCEQTYYKWQRKLFAMQSWRTR